MRSLIVIIVIAIFGQTAAQAQAGDVEIKSFPVLAAPGGRYVFAQISSFRRDQFLLDTQTGRVWTTANIGTKEKENIVLIPMQYFIDSVADGFRFTPVEATTSSSKR